MRTVRNIEARHRARMARYLMRCVDLLGLDYRTVAKEIGISTRRVRLMRGATPQLHVLQGLGELVETRSREATGASRARQVTSQQILSLL